MHKVIVLNAINIAFPETQKTFCIYFQHNLPRQLKNKLLKVCMLFLSL